MEAWRKEWKAKKAGAAGQAPRVVNGRAVGEVPPAVGAGKVAGIGPFRMTLRSEQNQIITWPNALLAYIGSSSSSVRMGEGSLHVSNLFEPRIPSRVIDLAR